MKIEYDPQKEISNRAKHGIDFSTVGEVFKDPKAITLYDEKHSSPFEKRYHIIGYDGFGILTIRFTVRTASKGEKVIRVFGAGYWRDERNSMKSNKKIIYNDAPKEEGWDFKKARPLSAEEQVEHGIPTAAAFSLLKKRKTERFNIRISAEDFEGLKSRAEEAGIPYQTLAAATIHQLAIGKIRCSFA